MMRFGESLPLHQLTKCTQKKINKKAIKQQSMTIHGNITQVDCEWVWVEVDKMVMMTSFGNGWMCVQVFHKQICTENKFAVCFDFFMELAHYWDNKFNKINFDNAHITGYGIKAWLKSEGRRIYLFCGEMVEFYWIG